MKKKINIGIIGHIDSIGINILKSNKISKYLKIIKINNNNQTDSKIISDLDAVILENGFVDNKFLKQAKNLKLVSRHGVGYDNVDIKHCKKKKVTVCITDKANSDTVAEYTISLLMYLTKNTIKYDSIVRNNKFKKRASLILNSELFDKSILIFGYGRIGSRVSKICSSLGMSVFVFDPYKKKKQVNCKNIKKIDKYNKIINNIDFISLHCPLTSKTKNIINYKLIKKMKKGVVIINTSRGGILNENDLIRGIKRKVIKYAALDVFENEPSINNKIRKNKKILLSPHAATFTKTCRIKMATQSAQNVIDFFNKRLNISTIIA